MYLARIRRYAVKAMAGEDLERVTVDARGLVGDRWFAVRDAEGRFAACKDTRRFRRRDAVARFSAHVDASGDTWVSDGANRYRVGDPVLDACISHAVGTPVAVTPEGEVPHQDAGQVSLVGEASVEWLARAWNVDLDARRLRPNLIVQTEQPFLEERWVGRHLSIGRDVVLRVTEPIPRCRTVDVAQDGIDPRHRLLKRLTRERQGLLGVYAEVVATGSINVGDMVGEIDVGENIR